MEIYRVNIFNIKRKAYSFTKTIVGFIVVISLLLNISSCMHAKPIKITEMKLQSDTAGHILNLRNYGDVNLELLNQAENLVINALITKSGDEFGYYAIDYSMSHYLYKGLSIMGHVIACYPLALFLGLPLNYVRYYLNANLYIFDSEGNLVVMYDEKKDFLHVESIYYGHNPTKKAAKQYSNMFAKMFEKANAESGVINTELKKKGVVTEENKKAALSKIRAFFATHKKGNSKISNLPM